MAINSKSTQEILDNLTQFIRINASKRLPKEVDLSEGSPIHDLFLLPQASQISFIYDLINELQFMQSIKNSDILTIEEMDRLGINWGVFRLGGNNSKGKVLFFSDKIPETTIEIPLGQRLVSESIFPEGSHEFEVTQTELITPDDFQEFTVNDKTVYGKEVEVQSLLAGESKNVPANVITKIIGNPIPGITDVTNLNPFTGGTDREPNNEYASRIITEVRGRNVGSFGHLESIIRDNFLSIEQFKFISSGPFMERDFGFGGKIDIYIKGEKLVLITEDIIVNDDDKDFTFTQKPVTNFDSISITPLIEQLDEATQEIVIIEDIDNILEEGIDYIIQKDASVFSFSIRDETKIIWLNKEKIKENQVRISYEYNFLVQEVQNKIEEEKLLGADILVKEAKKKEIIIAIEVDIDLVQAEDVSTIIEDIKDSISIFINTLHIGKSFSVQELVSILNSDQINRVHLPPIHFKFKNGEEEQDQLIPLDIEYLFIERDNIDIIIRSTQSESSGIALSIFDTF